VRFGDVAVDLAARAVTRSGEPVTLTPRQFDLLAALVRSGGRAMSRRELIDVAWPDANGSGARTIDTHIWHLRHRLEHDAAAPRHIMTVKKMGYRFQT
jgi:two-component system KDP operon response regulator KdpE